MPAEHPAREVLELREEPGERAARGLVVGVVAGQEVACGF